jgi:ATP-dependent RNA helicase DDX51/DBP6
MFSVQRYDASTSSNRGEGSSDGAGRLDRIALINQRKAALHEGAVPTQNGNATLLPTVAPNSASLIPPIGSNTPAPTIHPSRLAISHTLRQADQKAKALASGTSKEKTKAKQRYLKTKKERRKKRKAAAPKKSKRADEAPGVGHPQVQASDGSDSDSDSGTEDQEDGVENGAPPGKKQKVAPTEESKTSASENLDAAEMIEQSSTADSDSSSPDTASESDDSSMDEDGQEQVEKVQVVQYRDLNDHAEEEVKQDPVDIEMAALSRFPAPKRTLQASRKDLAAQGLPHGLANPQRIDPALSQTIKKTDQASFLDEISPAMKAKLAKMNITSWFAVQTAVIPLLMSKPQSRSLYPNPPLADLCVSAPTGSGKTLSYAVPIVEVLSNRIYRQLRALIILPTRDLVNQVKKTMTQIAKGTPLSIAAITGQQGFSQEQYLLVDHVEQRRIAGMMPPEEPLEEEDEDKSERRSKIDILIATPGRLIDHLTQTPGFTLQHLRFLVIDEADRLLGQSFQEWLPRVLDSLDPAKDPNMQDTSRSIKGGLAPAWLQYRKRHLAPPDPFRSVLMQEKEPVGVQKLLFSATLTRDPAKILALQLRNAAFVSVEEDETQDEGQRDTSRNNFIDRQESFALPASLTEHMIVTKGEDKPLDLLYLLYGHEHRLRQILCFTKSVENAARLVKLIEYFNESNKDDQVIVKEYSSDLNGMQRSRILQTFKEKKIDILVCSDVMARGIDLPDVRHVISYDAPIDMAKYVHRVGRTARANREGDAWTLVEEQEARHFKTMMKRGGRRSKIDKVKVKADQRESLQGRYDEALSKLESFYSR